MLEEVVADAGSPTGEAAGSAVQSGGQVTPDWNTFKGSLGEMGKDKSLEPIKDFNGLTKSYIEAQKMIGNSIRLPAKNAKLEDKQKATKEILGKLRAEGIIEGIPESPEKYDIKTPTVEGWKANEPLVGSFKQAAHKLGIPASQAQGLFDWYLNVQEETQAKSQTEFETMKRDMKKEMGGLFSRRMEAARRAVAKYIGADGDELISNLPPQVGRKLVLAFAEIGDSLLEDSLSMGGIPGVVTKDGIKEKIDTMMNDPKHPLNDVSHRQHKEAVEEYSNLQQQYIKLGGR
jgi:hypothetical protein